MYNKEKKLMDILFLVAVMELTIRVYWIKKMSGMINKILKNGVYLEIEDFTKE